MPMIKVCGISTRSTFEAAIGSGATAVGFMLARSRRQVTIHQVQELLKDIDRGEVDAVGVFVNEHPGTIAALVKQAGLDVVQLSGDEQPDVLDQIDAPIWKALRFPAEATVDEALDMVEPWFAAAVPAQRVFVDGAKSGAYGGTGHRADWQMAAEVAKRFPITLAGGLSPDNVAEAIEVVKPTGVEASSGLESNGVKDVELIRSFVEHAAQAFSSSR